MPAVIYFRHVPVIRIPVIKSFFFVCASCQRIFQAAIARGFHLFPFRTEKLSPAAPMVLPAKWESRSPPFSARGEGFHLDCFASLLFYTPLFMALLSHLIAE